MEGRLALAGATLVVASGVVAAASATATRHVEWKGGDSLALTALVPNPTRCGMPSDERPVLEAQLSGTGIDSVAGAFAVVASACLDLEALRVTDLVATDRFTAGPGPKATITIRSEDFTMGRNDASGVVYSRRPVRFRVTGATGSLAGAKGEGHYQIALSWPASRGLPQPAHVWFWGELLRP